MAELRPSLLSMRAFEAAARLRSVKDAASELDVTAGAVSQQIRKLEESLGVELLVRAQRRLEPTREGMELQQAFEGAFAQLDAAVERVVRRKGRTVRIGSAPSFCAKCILPRLPAFMAAEPSIDVGLELERSFVKLIESGFDIAVMFLPSPLEGFESRHLVSEALVPLASPALVERLGIRAPEDLLRAPLLGDDSMRSFPIDEPGWPEWLDRAGLGDAAPECAIAFDTSASHAIDAAVAGHGVLLGRRVLAQADIAAGRLVELFDLRLPMQCAYYLVTPEERLSEPAVEIVWDWMSRELLAA